MTSKYHEARTIAKEIIDKILSETPDCDTGKLSKKSRDFAHERCKRHAVSVYYGHAIDFCANNDTSEGEQFLEECGGIAQAGDAFSSIVCRVAEAALYCETIKQMNRMVNQALLGPLHKGASCRSGRYLT